MSEAPRNIPEENPAEIQTEIQTEIPEEYFSAEEKTTNHLAYYETKYDSDESNRGVNITLAANAINGKIIKPGEEFSFNSTVGSTTAEFGYKKATILVNGKKSTSYGGGVCQVSSTLCNAAITAGMTITERHDHSAPVAYIGDGKEAATSNRGKIDFKFKNEKSHAVMINAKAENGTISVTLTAI
jgi:vancomycin resistance protein YoaR